VSGFVVSRGWHDISLRWDISTPQAVVARLAELPGRGSMTQPGTKLMAETDRFGKWQHLLGPSNVLVVYVVDTPHHGRIRRLELQAHLGEAGEDDLCPPYEFWPRWSRLQTFMAMAGVLPPEDPMYVRVDPAVDVVYDDPQEGREVLAGLRAARWPRGWYAEFQGPPPYTTVAIKSGRKTVGRAYCRNTKTRNGNPRWGKLRFEREQRFAWHDRRPLEELSKDVAAAVFWGSVFGSGTASGRITRIGREEQTVKLVERVQLGDISTREFEQLTGFLDAERLGVTGKVYNPETARRRRALAKRIGISSSDAGSEPLDVSLDDLLAVPRAAWGGSRQGTPAAPTPGGVGAGEAGRYST
jgi:hypothetical protein